MTSTQSERSVTSQTATMLRKWLRHDRACPVETQGLAGCCTCGLTDTLHVLHDDEPYTLMAVHEAHVVFLVRQPMTCRISDSWPEPEYMHIHDLAVNERRVVRVGGELRVVYRTA